MTLTFVTGDLFQAKVDVLVNPANTVGVMGGGVALRIKQLFPESYPPYVDACAQRCLTIAKPLIVPLTGVKPSWIIHLATKQHWRQPSHLNYIKAGLKGLVEILQINPEITSVAMPALGCGLGGLRWEDVRPLIEQQLAPIAHVETFVYLPHDQHDQIA